MLLELGENVIYLNKKPIARDVKLNITPATRLIRMKTEILSEGDPKEVDLIMEYGHPSVSITPPSISIDIQCEEAIRGLYFDFRLSINQLRMKLMVDGIFNGKKVNRQIDSFLEILILIRSTI